MPHDENGLEIISATARIDEEEFLRKCAKDLARCEPTRPAPPAGVSCLELEDRLAGLCQQLGKACRDLVVAPLLKRIEQLEQGQLKLGGVYKSGQRYAENTLVSFQGGLWISRAPTETRPGSGSPSWRLCVKRGDAG